MTDTILAIEREKWHDLCALYSSDNPETVLGHSIISYFIRCVLDDPSCAEDEFTILSLNGDWSDGTFVAFAVNQKKIWVDTLNENDDRLYRLLILLKYSRNTRFNNVPSKAHLAILRMIEKRDLIKDYDNVTLLHFLARKKALEVSGKITEDITLKSLSTQEAKQVDDAWPHKHDTSYEFIKQLIRINPSVGAFDRNGRFVSWALRLPGGPIGALTTEKEFAGRGLGTLISNELTKRIAAMNESCCACVFDRNEVSKRIFQKMGYEIVGTAFWMGVSPKR